MAETLKMSIKFNEDNEFDPDNDDDSFEGSGAGGPLTEEKDSCISLETPREDSENEYDKKESTDINRDHMPKSKFMDITDLKPKKIQMNAFLQYQEKGGFSDMLSPKMSNLPTSTPAINQANAKMGTNVKEESSLRLINLNI